MGTLCRVCQFLSTLSLRRATLSAISFAVMTLYFYPRSPCGERPHCYKQTAYFFYFYPRSPCGERLLSMGLDGRFKLYFYPRSPCGERHVWVYPDGFGCLFLSTLSLRRATDVIAVITDAQSISIHALLAESDLIQAMPHLTVHLFLSTLSLRRATDETQENQSEHYISIHALLAESDLINGISLIKHINFYPRSPCGERQDTPLISMPKPDFYPRSPCGERQTFDKYKKSKTEFLSTLSLRRATGQRNSRCRCQLISIHALLAESDRISQRDKLQDSNFYPRSPCGERHQ